MNTGKEMTTSTIEYWDIETGEELDDYELHQRYDDMLDEIYESANIAGYEYQTSRALKEIDPIAYRCGFNDWLDAELGETITEREREA